jgi:hypothetical protein
VFWESGYSAIIYVLYATFLVYLGIFGYLLIHERGWRIYLFSIGGFCLMFSLMVLQGTVHLVIFAVYLFTTIVP